MSSTGNCKQINIVRDVLVYNMKRYNSENFIETRTDAFGCNWSGKLGIGFALLAAFTALLSCSEYAPLYENVHVLYILKTARVLGDG
jgi:hypothetical protein